MEVDAIDRRVVPQSTVWWKENRVGHSGVRREPQPSHSPRAGSDSQDRWTARMSSSLALRAEGLIASCCRGLVAEAVREKDTRPVDFRSACTKVNAGLEKSSVESETPGRRLELGSRLGPLSGHEANGHPWRPKDYSRTDRCGTTAPRHGPQPCLSLGRGRPCWRPQSIASADLCFALALWNGRDPILKALVSASTGRKGQSRGRT